MPDATCVLEGRVTNLSQLADAAGVRQDAAPEEILVRTFEVRGERALPDIRGSWSILFRGRDGSGFAARDPLGGRPLHYRLGPHGEIELAGEVRDLLAGARTTPGVDEVALAHWLARRPLPAGSTLFEGIRRLPAGHLLPLGSERSMPRRWWQPRYEAPAQAGRAEAVAILREGMEAAVRRAQGGDESVAVLLSGGFDSLAVAGLAASAPGSARAYSVVFPELPDVDESERIRQAAHAQGLELTALDYSEASPIAAAAEFAATWRLPQATPNRFVWRPVFERAATDGVAALLDGEGGDELFGCSPPLIGDRLRTGRVRSAIAYAQRLPGFSPEHSRRWTRRALRIYGVRDGLPPWAHRLVRRIGVGTAPPPPLWLTNYGRALLDPDADLQWKRLDGPRWWAALVRALIEFPDARSSADELRRATAMQGLDRRHPWRDLELVELILSLPPEYAFDSDVDRPLARDALRGTVDEPLLAPQPKPYFNRLLDDAIARSDRQRFEQVLNELPDPIGPLIDRRQLQLSLRTGADRRGGVGPALWPLVSAAVWLSSFDRSTGA